MGRSPCCDETSGLKKGPWTPEEDKKLLDYITNNGHGCWRSLPKLAGLNRCGKSCRLRWTNYLRPDIKRGKFSEEEERIILNLHSVLGNKWSKIATHLPGRTDNEIKNFWNTYLRKKLIQMGIDPNTHKPRTDLNHLLNLSQLLSSPHFMMNNFNTSNISTPISSTPWENALKLQTEVADQLVKIQLFQNLFQLMNNTTNLSAVPDLQNCANLLSTPQNLNLFQPQGEHGMQSITSFFPSNGNSNDAKDIDKPDSWAFMEGGVGGGGFDIHKENKGMIISNLAEQETRNCIHPLPALVSEPPPGTTSYQREYKSTSEPSSPIIFEAWDKLMDDDQANESYWKDILELMSNSPTHF